MSACCDSDDVGFSIVKVFFGKAYDVFSAFVASADGTDRMRSSDADTKQSGFVLQTIDNRHGVLRLGKHTLVILCGQSDAMILEPGISVAMVEYVKKSGHEMQR